MGQRLPVIIGFGGVNAAGRASGHHAYSRMVHSALSSPQRARTERALAQMMGLASESSETLSAAQVEHILQHTLVRRIEREHFDVDAVGWNQRLHAGGVDQPLRFEILQRNLPAVLPPHWEVTKTSVTHAEVVVRGEQDFLLPTQREFEVKSAGQLPQGFEPGTLYASRNHPRGLQMTIYAASDALGSLGLDWEALTAKIGADQISVYAGSAMGQLDGSGAGGMLKSRYNGQRVSAKHCPLSFAEMPADFINAYVLGSMGSTGASLGACASFLYNLRSGIEDIRSGRARLVLVGAAEAPITPEVMEGYAAMGALATVKGLRTLEGIDQDQDPDFRRACRPFAENCGFTIAESAQMLVLCDDALAMETGATMFGAAADVFVNADGHKKSISAPGVGNYITVAKALACVRAVLGEDAVRRGGLVQAHGTGTPQNRVTEARILSESAVAFGIENWPVVATKAYVGHSIGAAGGDQIAATLGLWEHGIIPGITTIDAVADDVAQEQLAFSNQHVPFDAASAQYALINSKGFGGNNASAALLSPGATQAMLKKRYSEREWAAWEAANASVLERQKDYDDAMIVGERPPIYRFDHAVVKDDAVSLSAEKITLGGQSIDLNLSSPYEDMRPD